MMLRATGGAQIGKGQAARVSTPHDPALSYLPDVPGGQSSWQLIAGSGYQIAES